MPILPIFDNPNDSPLVYTSMLLKSAALLETSSPIIKPNRPSTELKISMTRILTNLHRISPVFGMQESITHKVGSAASANAAPLPLMPTDTPQIKLHNPTVKPAQNTA